MVRPACVDVLRKIKTSYSALKYLDPVCHRPFRFGHNFPHFRNPTSDIFKRILDIGVSHDATFIGFQKS